MKLNLALVALILITLALIMPVSANVTQTNSTMRYTTDTAYPQEIWYVLFAVAVICLFLELAFIIMGSPPPSAMIIIGGLGMGLFLVLAMAAPMVGVTYVVTTDGDGIRHLVDYIFSPWVSMLCYGFSSIMLLFLFYGVLLYFKMLREYKANVEKHEEEAYFAGIWDTGV
jgi:hypothetical protein